MPWRQSSKGRNTEDSSESVPSEKRKLCRHKLYVDRNDEMVYKLKEMTECGKEEAQTQCEPEDHPPVLFESNGVKDNEQFVIIGEINVIQIDDAFEEPRVMHSDDQSGDQIEGTKLIDVMQIESIFIEEGNEIYIRNDQESVKDADQAYFIDTHNIFAEQRNIFEELYGGENNNSSEMCSGRKIELMDETNIMQVEEVVEEGKNITSDENNWQNIELQNRTDNGIISYEGNDEETNSTIESDEEMNYEGDIDTINEASDIKRNRDRKLVTVPSYITGKMNPSDTADTIASNTRYVVNMAFLFEQIRKKFGRDAHKPYDCTADNMFITGQRWVGLKTEFFVSCKMCGIQKSIWSEPLDGAYVGGRVESPYV